MCQALSQALPHFERLPKTLENSIPRLPRPIFWRDRSFLTVTAVTTSVNNDLSASVLIALANPVIIRLLLKKGEETPDTSTMFGGGGGNRTHVRKPLAAESTCLSAFLLSSQQANKSGKSTRLDVLQKCSQPSPEGNRMAENPAK